MGYELTRSTQKNTKNKRIKLLQESGNGIENFFGKRRLLLEPFRFTVRAHKREEKTNQTEIISIIR
jgi:hypothetical protein